MTFGIIGGSGLYQMPGLKISKTLDIETPYGAHSGPISIGEISGKKVIFLPRHGAGHALLPGEINYRANIWALKHLGAKRVISVSSVGSLNDLFKPGDFVIPDQYIDWTKGQRAASFFGEGVVAHVSMAEPSCAALSAKFASIANIHRPATHICIEGPRYSTRAESFMLQKLGCDTIGMTAVPEVFLAREANLCHITLAAITDYDSWRINTSEHVSALGVETQSSNNAQRVIELLSKVLGSAGGLEPCGCSQATNSALLTPKTKIPGEKLKQLFWL